MLTQRLKTKHLDNALTLLEMYYVERRKLIFNKLIVHLINIRHNFFTFKVQIFILDTKEEVSMKMAKLQTMWKLNRSCHIKRTKCLLYKLEVRYPFIGHNLVSNIDHHHELIKVSKYSLLNLLLKTYRVSIFYR